MTLPAFVLGAVLSTVFGAAFHLWRGGSGLRLLLYLALAWGGFWGGHWVAEQLGWNFASLGPLHIGLASLGSWLILGLGYWLSLVQTN